MNQEPEDLGECWLLLKHRGRTIRGQQSITAYLATLPLNETADAIVTNTNGFSTSLGKLRASDGP